MIDDNYFFQSKKKNKKINMIKDNQIVKVKVEKRTMDHYSKFGINLTDKNIEILQIKKFNIYYVI